MVEESGFRNAQFPRLNREREKFGAGKGQFGARVPLLRVRRAWRGELFGP
jgi:hypothetical protein